MMPIRFPSRTTRLAIVLGIVISMSGCAAYQHHRAGMAAIERGDFAAAVNELKLAAELAPQDVEFRRDWLKQREIATNKLLANADTAMADGQSAKAENAYRIILSYDRENSRAHAGLENIARGSRAMDDAVEARKALQAGDISRALLAASRALERSPNHPEARAVMRDIEAAQLKDPISAATLSAAYKKPINLEFRDASLKMVFEALSRTTGINFIFDRDVKSDLKTTVFLKQTSLEDSIEVILATNQLDKKILNATSVLIYPNSPAKVKEYQDLIVKVFYLANAEAKQTANMLKTVLKVKEVFVDDRYNMVILRENPETIALADKLIALHDLEEPEVMIEVAVMEVNRSSLLNLGIQITDQLTITPLGGLRASGSSSSATTGATLTLNELRNLNSDSIGINAPSATINLQNRDGDAKLLANPSLRVRDREKAKVMIGDKVPVVTTTSTPNGFVAENIQYLDVGLKLEVEPTIRLRDEIGLKISLEVSSLVSSIKTNNGSQAYQIGTRNYNSVLRLKDGETQILAGLISDEDRSSANRIPLLGKLPVLGRLFSSQSDSRQKTEIIMSITPRLIRNIQRKDPSAESFWSGTESSLRTRPLQLRPIDTGTSAQSQSPSPSASSSPTIKQSRSAPPPLSGAATSTASTDTMPVGVTGVASELKLQWKGPAAAKIGEVVTLELNLESVDALRATPLQIGVNPALFEIVVVREGNFFSQGGRSSFGENVDKSSGRISVAATSNEPAGIKGAGRILSVELKVLAADADAEIVLQSLTPVGSTKALARPSMPVSHKISTSR